MILPASLARNLINSRISLCIRFDIFLKVKLSAIQVKGTEVFEVIAFEHTPGIYI